MPYTPELDNSACTTLRRLSWAIGEPMTKTMKEVFKFLPLLMDSGKVCSECEDTSKCNECYFNQKKKEDLKNEMFTDVVEKDNLQSDFYNSRFTERSKKKKKRKPKLCKSCEKKVKEQEKKQSTVRTGKEWTPEMGAFI